MIHRSGSAALAIIATLALASGCGGGGKSAKRPDGPTTTKRDLSTTTTIDGALRDLVLVAADLPKFKEETTPPAKDEETFAVCEPSDAPAAYALVDEPSVDGPKFARGPDGAVSVSSTATATTPEKAEAALTELTDPKLNGCYESDVRKGIEKDVPEASEITVKLTVTKPSVAGVDQAAVLSAAIAFKANGKPGAVRSDFVLLRRQGTILSFFYSGSTSLASAAERQGIIATAAKKLSGDTGGTSTTSGSGSSSSTSGGGSSTTRRSSSTTSRGSTTSRTGGGSTTTHT